MEQPISPPEDNGCEVCGRQCSHRVCLECKIDVNKTDRDE